MFVAEEKTGSVAASTNQTIDEILEFQAPKFYDFVMGESKEEAREAELWFNSDKIYPPSPFVPKIKSRHSSEKVQSHCEFDESETIIEINSEETKRQEQTNDQVKFAEEIQAIDNITEDIDGKENIKPKNCFTPTPPENECSNSTTKINKKGNQSRSKPSSIKSAVINTQGKPHFAHENQAIKRQKLDGGKTREILCLKPPQPLPHKSKLGVTNHTEKTLPKEERKMYVREREFHPPFVSMAEMMKKFQSNTREVLIPNCSLTKPKLTLTRPKEPEFETMNRIRSVKVKSSAEIEEEMLAQIPKFKARPLNKRILEAPTLFALQRTTPKIIEFHEFYLHTSARAAVNSDTSSVPSADDSSSNQKKEWKPHLTQPKTPLLHTSLRSRPPAMKTSEELETEELEKIPKFKARPLNRKIFESKGEMGVYCNTKKQVTVPREFHFAIDERIPPPTELFEKLSLCSFSTNKSLPPLPRKTTLNPFHLRTEERGAQKEKKFTEQNIHKQIEAETARIPIANPYPFTTDFPVIPPKPEPKEATKPEPFQLEGLVRHEEEIRRENEEQQRKDIEEEKMRLFKAQPILKRDPIPLPEKVRKPLTQIQQFTLHVDQRAPEREEFDTKIKEKNNQYKRFREESEAAKMIEEEKAQKQLRRAMIHHPTPVPKFDHPFIPRKSTKPTTKAKSPRLQIIKRKETTASAVNMR